MTKEYVEENSIAEGDVEVNMTSIHTIRLKIMLLEMKVH